MWVPVHISWFTVISLPTTTLRDFHILPCSGTARCLYGKITLRWIQHDSNGNPNKTFILKLDQTLLSLPGRINPASLSTCQMWALNSTQLHLYDSVYVELLSMLNSFVEWLHAHMRISRKILETSNESHISLVSWKYIILYICKHLRSVVWWSLVSWNWEFRVDLVIYGNLRYDKDVIINS